MKKIKQGSYDSRGLDILPIPGMIYTDFLRTIYCKTISRDFHEITHDPCLVSFRHSRQESLQQLPGFHLLRQLLPLLYQHRLHLVQQSPGFAGVVGKALLRRLLDLEGILGMQYDPAAY